MPSRYIEGLWIASALSISNVITDVFRKKALSSNEFYSTSFWIRLTSLILFLCVFLVRIVWYGWPALLSVAQAGVASGNSLPLWARFAIYFLVDVSIVATAQLLYLRALQFADLSYFVPFVSLTPVMLIPTGFLLVGEMPLPHQIAGVLLIVAGSLAMNSDAVQGGMVAMLRAPLGHRASRYALLIAFLFALSNPVDKIVAGIAGPVPYAVSYNFGLLTVFGILAARNGVLGLRWVKGTLLWILLGGSLDALTLLLQFTAYRYLDVVLVIGLKRAGVILSVLAGWLIFREKGIRGRLYATGIMATGLFLIYTPLPRPVQVVLFAMGLGAFTFRMPWRRRMEGRVGARAGSSTESAN